MPGRSWTAALPSASVASSWLTENATNRAGIRVRQAMSRAEGIRKGFGQQIEEMSKHFVTHRIANRR